MDGHYLDFVKPAISSKSKTPDDDPNSHTSDYYRDYFPIEKNLSQLQADDLTLARIITENSYPCYGICYLIFEKQPENQNNIEIEVKITLSDGRLFSQTIEKEF